MFLYFFPVVKNETNYFWLQLDSNLKKALKLSFLTTWFELQKVLLTVVSPVFSRWKTRFWFTLTNIVVLSNTGSLTARFVFIFNFEVSAPPYLEMFSYKQKTPQICFLWVPEQGGCFRSSLYIRNFFRHLKLEAPFARAPPYVPIFKCRQRINCGKFGAKSFTCFEIENDGIQLLFRRI